MIKTARRVLAFSLPFVKPYWGRLALGLALGICFGLFNASFIWGTKTLFQRLDGDSTRVETKGETWETKFQEINRDVTQAVDPWLPLKDRQLDWRQVAGGLFLLPLLVAVRSTIGYFSVYFLTWVSESAVRDIRMATHKKLQTFSIDYFQNRQIGDQTMLLNAGARTLHRCLTYGIADAIKEPFTILSILAALFILDWQLALFGVLFAPLSAIPIILVGRKLRKVAKADYLKGTEQDSLMVEAYGNVKTVKAYGLEEKQLSRFQKIYQRLARLGMKSMQARHLQNPVIELLSMLGVGAVILFVFSTGKTTPELVGFLTGMIMLYQPIKKLGGLNAYYQQAIVGVEMMEAVFSTKPSVEEREHARNLEVIQKSLRLEAVTFAYDGAPVLKSLDLELHKGMRLGIAGESGAGKSTMANLLLRFYDPQEGCITIDGQDVRDATFKSLRGQMALVSQEVVIFNQSVAENIACGKQEATREEILAAARAANAHEFIEELPEGYDTMLGEQGARLSGGQRQRIAIARAFVREAPILILDEATAALDSKAESEVQAAIEKLEEGRTVICVAHRLSTLRNMDRIIVLEGGEMVESGSFLELMELGGKFSEMARKQGIGVEVVDKGSATEAAN